MSTHAWLSRVACGWEERACMEASTRITKTVMTKGMISQRGALVWRFNERGGIAIRATPPLLLFPALGALGVRAGS